MLRFGIIAEGRTDQKVIKNILLGYFQAEEEDTVVIPIQPLQATSEAPDPPGGWTRVFASLKRGDPQEFLSRNSDGYLVIHIDTDKQDEPGFDVPRREGGVELDIPTRVERVTARLMKDIDAAIYEAYKDRILFAVSVETIECWLLPLLYADKKKAAKTTGCLNAANTALRKQNKVGLSVKHPVPAYEQASNDYTKHTTLMKQRDRNSSLDLFIKQLDELKSKRSSAPEG